MTLSVAQAHALDLAQSLMLTVLLIQGDEGYGIMLAAEYDGETARIVHECDPFALEPPS